VKDKRIEKYLQPLDNPYVQADVRNSQDGTATKISYTLTPDSTDAFLSELGIAYLLDASFDRVQWIGNGPFATYPGRTKANRYGFWAKHMDDLYFEGNRMGIDAALFSDKDGNGLLVVGDSLNLNFEQTDRGIVMTVNSAVSGQGPKFARTAFPVISKKVGTLKGSFSIYRVDAGS
jgi:beta-galactosidase